MFNTMRKKWRSIMTKYMVKTNTPVIWDNRNCGQLINFYRITADSKKEVMEKYISQDRHDREMIEYIRSYT